MKTAITVLGAVILLTACADTHQLVVNPTGAQTKLTASDSFYVAVSRDGSYGSKTYQGSGLMTSQVLQSALAKHARTVQSGRSFESFDEGLKAARKKNSRYLVYPTIIAWEDRATEWSGIPDRVAVKIEVVQALNEETVASATINGKSGLATFGGDHPQDLLPQPVADFVSTLFQ